MNKFRWIGIALTLLLTTYAGTAQAEVKEFRVISGRKLFPYYKIRLKPPYGWVIEKKATRERYDQIIVPEGKNYDTAPALIYVYVSNLYKRGNIPLTYLADYAHNDINIKIGATKPLAYLDNYARDVIKKIPIITTKISELSAVERANANRDFFASLLKIREKNAEPTSFKLSVSIPTRMAINISSKWS